jgi:pseudaminic acid biosynthesis-associated methylase
MTNQDASEAARLEELWSGDFGDQYVERNAAAGEARAPFWSDFLQRFPARRALEVGCNVGANLRHLDAVVDAWGVDVNRRSLELLHERLPRVNAGWATARDLPFRDGWFDLTFTVAVLIHQPEDTLALAMAELVRCSRRWVLAVEYTATDVTVVDYRGQRDAFFKRDYGARFRSLFPELIVREEGELTKAQGFDDGLGYWVLEKA